MPFFTVQTFCVALWCLDEHWDYSLFTLFMLIMLERTVVWQRVRTLTEFRSMSIEPYPIQCYHDGKWVKVQTDELLPGDIASLGECYILISELQSTKSIRIPKPPFLPTCCSSAAGVSPMLSCSRLNRRPFGRNQSSCGGRMHVLTPTERTNMLRYLAIPRSCNRAQESAPVLSLRLQRCIYCIDI